MFRAEEYKLKAARVLRGEGSDSDLSMLFLWLRRNSLGNKAVADVGNFVAHAEERDAGLAWRSIRRVWEMMNYHLPKNDLQLPRSHHQLTAAAMAAFETFGPNEVRKRTGLAYDQAKRLLKRGLGHTYIMGSKLALASEATPQELAMVKMFASVVPFYPSFSHIDLEQQFVAALRGNKLVPKNCPADSSLKRQLAVFTILHLHLAAIRWEDGQVAILRTGSHGPPEQRSVGIKAYFRLPDVPDRDYSCTVFWTDLNPTECCEPDLASTEKWLLPVEIGPTGRFQVHK